MFVRNSEAGSGEAGKEKGSVDRRRLAPWRVCRACISRARREEEEKEGRTAREGRGTSAGDKAFEYSRKVSMELTPASCPTEFEFNE